VLEKNKQLFGKVKQALEPLQNTRMSYKRRVIGSITKEPLYDEILKNIRQEELNVKQRRVKILRSYNNYLSLKSIKQ
jgi:hypothetical protein